MLAMCHHVFSPIFDGWKKSSTYTIVSLFLYDVNFHDSSIKNSPWVSVFPYFITSFDRYTLVPHIQHPCEFLLPGVGMEGC